MRREIDVPERNASGQQQPMKVDIVGVDVPFGDLVRFTFKWIPAMVIGGALWGIIGGVVAAVMLAGCLQL